MLRSLKKAFNKLKSFFSNLALERLVKKRFIIAFAMIKLQENSRKYLTGGLQGYFYCRTLNSRINLKNSIILGYRFQNKKCFHEVPRLERELNIGQSVYSRSFEILPQQSLANSHTLLSLLPAEWPRLKSEIGFPHAWHIVESARAAGVKLLDFPTHYISGNPENSQQHLIDLEWEEILGGLNGIQVDILVLSGNKRSYSDKITHGLDNLRVKNPDMKVCLLMLDDWNEEYCRLVEKWDAFIDFVLVYEFESYISKFAKMKNAQIVVWPFPRHSIEIISDQIDRSSEYNFFGSLYLNRLPWLYLINRFISQTSDKVKFNALSSISAGNYRLTIEDYLKQFAGHNKIFFHFLERTPGAFTLTASVWDSLANGSLAIVQTESGKDPLEKFFIPGVHYLQFSCAHELKEIIQTLSEDKSLASRIAKSGHEYFLKHYNSVQLFSNLFYDVKGQESGKAGSIPTLTLRRQKDEQE